MTVLIAIGFANDEWCPHAGLYLKSFDFEHEDGLGYGEFTTDRAEAKEFKDAGEALEFWRTVSKVRPQRPDGKPNRPLTVLTVEVAP